MKNRLLCFALIAAVCVGLAARPAVAAAPPSADEYYRDALAQMRSIVEPAYLNYQTEVPSGRSTILVTAGKDGRAQLAILVSNKVQPPKSWDVAYRSSDGAASIALPDGHAISELPLFDPTWRGAYNWMHKGFEASMVDSSGPATPSPAPASAATPNPVALPVIAMVSAIGPGFYRVEDGGAANCVDGRAGHHLHLIARSDPSDHPLTDVVIDTQSMRFCSMRFHEGVGNALLGLSFDIDLHFGTVGSYYLITDGAVVGVGKAMLVTALHVATAFRYEGVQAPASLPDTLFTLQPAAPVSTT